MRCQVWLGCCPREPGLGRGRGLPGATGGGGHEEPLQKRGTWVGHCFLSAGGNTAGHYEHKAGRWLLLAFP